MESGIKEEGAKDGVDAFMIGPTSANPTLQVRAIEDLIAKKVNVIGVVPERREGAGAVLEKARKGNFGNPTARGQRLILIPDAKALSNSKPILLACGTRRANGPQRWRA